ncbi:MAG: hypothetical protein R2838_01545 [Caldilineaceae bacterium]
MDTLGFLRQVPPFDRLDQETLTGAAAAMTVRCAWRGAQILQQGDAPSVPELDPPGRGRADPGMGA